MRTVLPTYCLSFLLLLCLLAPAFGHAATATYVYEQKDAAQEQKRYLVKLTQDKRKCELAITNTKTLIGRSKNRPYLPELYLRLAELYIEKSRIVFFLRKNQQSDKGGRALDQYEANTLKQQAIEIYQRILTHHPDFDQSDKVLFFMAHEYRELGQIKEMLTKYKAIIATYPHSQYVPESHLLLGDYFFSQKQDVEKAKTHYEAVLAHSKSPAAAAARYKLAWCQINLVDYKGALKLFEESVLSPQAKKELDIDTYQRVDVRLESLVDMAYCYPEVHKKTKPEEALVYFRRYAWSRPVYTTVLEKLAYRYYVKKRWHHCAAVYRELAGLRQDPDKLIEYAKQIFECVQILGTYEHAEKDVAIIVRALERQRYSVHVADAEKEKLINDFEIYAREIITHLHAKARKSNSKKDFQVAAGAYKQYLQFFTGNPAVEEMAANYAEALFSCDRFWEAGKQYEKVTPKATVNQRQRKDTLYSAVISYYRALKNKDDLNFYQAAYAREGLRSAGHTYAAEYPHSKQTPDVRFNVAWAAYDAGNYQAAIKDFSNFVNEYPTHKASKAAVHLAMDAFHLTDNYEGMVSYGRSVLSSPHIKDRQLKKEIAQIVRSAESKVVSTMTMSAADDWENARRDLMQVARGSGSGAMGEQALNALILSSKDQQDLPTLYEAGTKLIGSYPKSAQARETMGILIDTSVKIGQFRMLADYFEQYAQRYPKDEHSADFLMQAAHIREGLGQHNQANKNYRRLMTSGKVGKQQLESVLFAYADNAEQSGQADTALDILRRNMPKLSPTAKVRAQAQMAVLSGRNNRLSQARKYRQQAKKAYRSQMGREVTELRDLMAEMVYGEVYRSSKQYYNLQLKNTIDNKIVSQKAKLLQTVEDGYQQVMAYKSPGWALRACFRANEINREFARFLIQSPLPAGLDAQQKAQYRSLIKQKAQAYMNKADQYLKTCVQMAEKWEICDPQLAGYFNPPDRPQGRENSFAALSGKQPSAEIARQGLTNETILALYRKLLKSPDDYQLQLELAQAYLNQGDYLQAALIVHNTLPKLKGGQQRLKARFLNLLGVTHLYSGSDAMAKEAFKEALDADGALAAARINLAGIYRHYGHAEKAAGLIKGPLPKNADREEIHPRVGAIYHEYVMQTQ